MPSEDFDRVNWITVVKKPSVVGFKVVRRGERKGGRKRWRKGRKKETREEVRKGRREVT